MEKLKLTLAMVLEAFDFEKDPDTLFIKGFPVKLHDGKTGIRIFENIWNDGDGLGFFFLDYEPPSGEMIYLRMSYQEMLEKEVVRNGIGHDGKIHAGIDLSDARFTIWPPESGLQRDEDNTWIVKYPAPPGEAITMAGHLRKQYNIPAYAVYDGVVYDRQALRDCKSYPLGGNLAELWYGGDSIFHLEAVTPTQRQTLRRIAARMSKQT